MKDLLANPQVAQAVAVALGLLLTVVTIILKGYITKLGGEANAKVIGFKAIEEVDAEAKAGLPSDGSMDTEAKRIATAVGEALRAVKAKVQRNAMAADEPTKDAVRTGVDEVDKKKPTPLRRVGGVLFALLKARIGM